MTWSADFTDARREKTRTRRNSAPFDPAFELPSLKILVHGECLNKYPRVSRYIDFLRNISPGNSGIEIVPFDPIVGKINDAAWHQDSNGSFWWSDGNKWRSCAGRRYAEEECRRFSERSNLEIEEAAEVYRWFEAATSIPEVAVFVTDCPDFLRFPYADGVQMVDPTNALGTIGFYMRLRGKTLLPSMESLKFRQVLDDPEYWAVDVMVPEISNLFEFSWVDESQSSFQLLHVARSRLARCLALRDELIASYTFHGWRRRLGDPSDILVDFALHLYGHIEALALSLKRTVPSIDKKYQDRNIWRDSDLRALAAAVGGSTGPLVSGECFQAYRKSVGIIRNTIHSIPLGRGYEGGAGRNGPVVYLLDQDVDKFIDSARVLGRVDEWIYEPQWEGDAWASDHPPKINPIALVDDLLDMSISFMRQVLQDDPWRDLHDGLMRRAVETWPKSETSLLPLLYGMAGIGELEDRDD